MSLFWKGGRVVNCNGLENRDFSGSRGFESLPFRWLNSYVQLKIRMKKFSKYFLLLLLNWLIFIVFYFLRLFDFMAFKAVSESLSSLPFPLIIRSILIVIWMIVPQTIALVGFNKMYLKIPTKQFIWNQLLFVCLLVLLLEAVLRAAK